VNATAAPIRLVEYDSRRRAAVTVAVSLHNYGGFIIEALDSVEAQTLDGIELVVIDDASTDDGPERSARWLRRHRRRFTRALLLQQAVNGGLAAARNLAVAHAEAPLLFVLDADNAMYPRCLERLAAALAAARASAFAYPVIEVFGENRGLMGTPVWSRSRLAAGNYIDAMALIRTSRLREVGGYARMPVTGWEDYDLWCRFAERGWPGIRVPEILARYRAHRSSMLNTTTRREDRTAALINDMKSRHPWLTITPEQH
jgi:glycosyltransferase involved in cell wall biosynthesis